MPDERPWVALTVLAAAVLLWPPPVASSVRRLRDRSSPGVPTGLHAGRLPAVGPAGRRWLVSAASAAGVAVLFGAGPVAWGGAAAVAVAAERVLRRRATSGDGLDLAGVERDLPVVCDLLAVCLGSGLPLSTALAEVAAAVPGAVGERLRAVATSLALGADPGQAWAAAPPGFASLGRVLIRAAESGSSAGGALRSLSAQLRGAAGARAEVAVRRAGVWILAPLGLCFLPAFVCLGVLPLVLGIAGDVFR